MSPAVATFAFELVNFLLLSALLGWLLFKPIRAHLESRRDAITQQSQQLADREDAISKGRADLEQRVAAFDASVQHTRQERLEAADREADAIVARAREAAAHEQDRVKQTLGHVEREQLDRLADALAVAGRESVAALLARFGMPDLDAGLVHAASREVAAMSAGSLGNVRVESAHELDADARAELTTAIGERCSSLEFNVAPALGAGVRITTASGLIDASARGIGAEAERRLKDALTAGATPPS
jgi:F0F1-type ATP synthase membrane subunit b/b'